MIKRAISLLLVLAVCFSLVPRVWADDSTTTYGTAYKDLSARTEIYIVTDSAYEDYPYYGAKWEPKGGVYYGRIAYGGPTENGWGVVNEAQLENESATSFYYSLGDPYGLEYWSYLYGAVTKDQEHMLLINLNFEGEGDDCEAVLRGDFDQQLIEDFQYLNTMTFPTFLRIGGEVNVWTVAAAPERFISAYRHIAELARTHCPNAALVFSPNYSSPYGTDMDDFYPGDAYVDWIGTSLYYNQYADNGDTTRDAFYGVGQYGDPMLNIQQTVNLAELHSKPIIITEGGSQRINKGVDMSPFAAEKIRKAYSFLTMVYPQIKCMVYSDAAFGSTTFSYTIYDAPQLQNAYDQGVLSNPTYVHRYQDTGAYYTKLSSYTDPLAGTVELAAYSYSADPLEAVWYVNGEPVHSTDEYPYSFRLDTKSLTEESNTLEVRFSNGASKIYFITDQKLVSGIYFSDIAPDAYYYDSVLWAVENGITNGTDASHFSPSVPCTRAQVVTFLWRAAGSPEPASAQNPFADVPSQEYYYKAVLWAAEKGITNGTGANRFSPDEPCTRAQVVTLLWRAEGMPAVSSRNAFTDVKKGTYYYDAVLWAVENAVTNGIGADKFAPDIICTRDQIVTFLYRAMN